MKKIVTFFRTSPMEKRGIITNLMALLISEAFFALVIIYALKFDGLFSALLFATIGIIILIVRVYQINPEMCRKFWHRFWKKIKDGWVMEIPRDSTPNRIIDC